MNNSNSFENRLLDGETIKCKKCKDGVYKPVNPAYKKNHGYICDKCGDRIFFEENVIVD